MFAPFPKPTSRTSSSGCIRAGPAGLRRGGHSRKSRTGNSSGLDRVSRGPSRQPIGCTGTRGASFRPTPREGRHHGRCGARGSPPERRQSARLARKWPTGRTTAEDRDDHAPRQVDALNAGPVGLSPPTSASAARKPSSFDHRNRSLTVGVCAGVTDGRREGLPRFHGRHRSPRLARRREFRVHCPAPAPDVRDGNAPQAVAGTRTHPLSPNSASTVRSIAKSTGLVRCRSKPASRARILSSSCP